MDFVLVGLSGIVGGLTRYFIDLYFSKRIKNKFPLGTFFVNISGSFLIGFFSKIAFDEGMRTYIVVGFLGAYTTFSTFIAEGSNIIEKNKVLHHYGYVLLSVVAGVAMCFLGMKCF